MSLPLTGLKKTTEDKHDCIVTHVRDERSEN